MAGTRRRFCKFSRSGAVPPLELERRMQRERVGRRGQEVDVQPEHALDGRDTLVQLARLSGGRESG